VESVIELYAASVCIFYGCCATVIMSCREVAGYTRSKDLKNACTHLSNKTKSSGMVWGFIWPVWLIYSLVKRKRD
jgi:hypothetical protein